MFSQACVTNSVHGGGACTPLYARHHPLGRHRPSLGRPPSRRRPLQRTVRILLECILVSIFCLNEISVDDSSGPDVSDSDAIIHRRPTQPHHAVTTQYVLSQTPEGMAHNKQESLWDEGQHPPPPLANRCMGYIYWPPPRLSNHMGNPATWNCSNLFIWDPLHLWTDWYTDITETLPSQKLRMGGNYTRIMPML